ncbi:hypothetical protein [Marinimicrobium locisalis]|uniref:hypothetical protein n=1 Tax=Marinimicrobium locisalis TaxID=546022 RepID=UPI0032221845
MTDQLYRSYIYDLGTLLKQKAKDAKLGKEAAFDTNDADYKLGYLMAFHEVISLMQQQADSFGIERKVIGLEDIEPEIDLL